MVLLYTPKQKTNNVQTITANILDLDYQGLGVAKINGKTWFIENALPQERVECHVLEEKRQYGRAVAKKYLIKSPERVVPQCAYYGRCGGCQTQHIFVEMQREAKQAALFKRLSKLQSDPIAFQPMICGEPWSYRRRVRLSLWFNPKTKQIEMGFRQKNSNDLIAVQSCEVVEPAINHLLPKLIALLADYSAPKQLGHIELDAADFHTFMYHCNAYSGYNMFITGRKHFDEYSQWLFSVLFELEKRVKLSAYPDQARLFGYLSERLINVYCIRHRLKIKYVPVIMPLEETFQNPSNLLYTLRRLKNDLIYKLTEL